MYRQTDRQTDRQSDEILTPYTGVRVIFFLVKICYLPARFARRGIITNIIVNIEQRHGDTNVGTNGGTSGDKSGDTIDTNDTNVGINLKPRTCSTAHLYSS